MADRVEVRDFTIVAGIPSTSPVTFPMTWRQGYPVRVELRFPPGPSGLVGLRLEHSGLPVIPHDGSDFIVADNEVIDWELTLKNYQPKWTAVGYNTGAYPHTIQIRMHLNEIEMHGIQSVPSAPIPMTNPSSGLLLEGLQG